MTSEVDRSGVTGEVVSGAGTRVDARMRGAGREVAGCRAARELRKENMMSASESQEGINRRRRGEHER